MGKTIARRLCGTALARRTSRIPHRGTTLPVHGLFRSALSAAAVVCRKRLVVLNRSLWSGVREKLLELVVGTLSTVKH